MTPDENKYLAQVTLYGHGGTEKALAVSTDGMDRQWVPRSTIVWCHFDRGGMVTIIVPEWYAVKRGWVDDPRLRGAVDAGVV